MGFALALLANLMSPHGLKLTRNYFPGAARPLPVATAGTPGSTNGAATQATGPATEAALIARLQAQGLQLITGAEVRTLYRDPRYAQERVVLVDARDDEAYQSGHIPGAFQLNHYRPEGHLPAVLPACLNAQQVVVYCTGGDCEDSEFAALMLRAAGIPNDRLFVYGGGLADWQASGSPLETGARKSGVLIHPKTP